MIECGVFVLKSVTTYRTSESDLRQQMDTAKNERRELQKEMEELKRRLVDCEGDKRNNINLLEQMKKERQVLIKKIEMVGSSRQSTRCHWMLLYNTITNTFELVKDIHSFDVIFLRKNMLHFCKKNLWETCFKQITLSTGFWLFGWIEKVTMKKKLNYIQEIGNCSWKQTSAALIWPLERLLYREKLSRSH